MLKKIKFLVLENFKRNIKVYVILLSILLLGVMFGVFITNNMEEQNRLIVKNYLENNFNNLKNLERIEYSSIFNKIIFKNLTIVFLLILLNFSIFGKISTYFATFTKGFTMGYAVSNLIYTFGNLNGLLISLLMIFLINIFFIPIFMYSSVETNNIYGDLINENDNKKNLLYKSILLIIVVILIITLLALLETFVNYSLIYELCKKLL